MDMEAVTIRLPKKMIARLDQAVEAGDYPNKSEAVREACRLLIRMQKGMLEPVSSPFLEKKEKDEAARKLLEGMGYGDEEIQKYLE